MSSLSIMILLFIGVTCSNTEASAAAKGDPFVYLFSYFKYTEHRHGAVMSIDLTTWTGISDRAQFAGGMRDGAVFKTDRAVLDELIALNEAAGQEKNKITQTSTAHTP